MPFAGERQEPNPLQWLRFEFVGQGFSSRLFYNEVPKPTWWRYQGHFLNNPEDEKERDRKLYSFTHANQIQDINFGIDTTTPEGRAAFKAHHDEIAEMTPELVSKDDIVFPHEALPSITNEPHFRRVWSFYRNHSFRAFFTQQVESGAISEEDAATFEKWIDLTGQPSFQIYLMARQGQLDHLKDDPGFQATTRVFEAMGLGDIKFSNVTAEPIEEQFWTQFDQLYKLTEQGLREDLPYFVTDPSNRAKVEALLAGHEGALDQETTQKLA